MQHRKVPHPLKSQVAATQRTLVAAQRSPPKFQVAWAATLPIRAAALGLPKFPVDAIRHTLAAALLLLKSPAVATQHTPAAALPLPRSQEAATQLIPAAVLLPLGSPVVVTPLIPVAAPARLW
ncbi:hypothetical protein APSETT445_005030 [Aspergillus pseudonomiae]